MYSSQPIRQHPHADHATCDLPIFIRYRKRHFQGTRLRALSSHEVEVAVRALTLPPGTPVELEFLHSGRNWRLPAQVASGSADGIGLRFQDPQPELLRDLVALNTQMLGGASACPQR